MKTLETERLILRPFRETDFDAVHAYASIAENIRYMTGGRTAKPRLRHLSRMYYAVGGNRAKITIMLPS